MLSEIVKTFKGRFLMLGKCDAEIAAFKAEKWSGIVVAPNWAQLNDEDYYSEISYLEGHLYQEAHFQRDVRGIWLKPLMVEDIFAQWGDKRFDIIVIDVPSLTHTLWFLDCIQEHLPRFYVIKNDGYNDPVIARAKDRGYWVLFDDDWIIMRHRRAAEESILTEKEKGA